ncbi:hypothetical protein [Agromyces atrinae]|uniref:GGDEF domain-containing protein n=1 Tax=Agromyces atrinae TaxID=592376 RepID=A0A4Q2M9W9_9MICO|nr:hypothetical protein [Agromyces atrinae]NYD67320.1 hypothetical protein [Agromyces atrinae]RXZ86851.1 hypothetical protein ESP50_07250 [Agromyces atrinae]
MPNDVMLVSGIALIVVCACAGAFVVQVRRTTRSPSRGLWWAAFSAAAFASIASALMIFLGHEWWIVAASNGFMAAAVGLYWSGARAFNGRPAMLEITVPLSLAVFIVSALPSPSGVEWAGAPLRFGTIVVFSVLVAVEALRRPLRRVRASFIVAAALLVQAVYSAARLVVFLVAGPESDVFTSIFSTFATTVLNVALVLVVTGCTIAIKIGYTHDAMLGSRVERTSIVPMRQLVRLAERRGPDAIGLVVVASIESHRLLVSAYGRPRIDEVQQHLVAALIDTLPTGCLVSERRSGEVVAASARPHGTSTASIEDTVARLFAASAAENGIPVLAAAVAAEPVVDAPSRDTSTGGVTAAITRARRRVASALAE